MGLVKLECPGCAASIEMDASREFGFCPNCGTKVMVDRVIVEHKGKIVVDKSDELDNLYILARRARTENNIDNALKYYEQILLRAPLDWEASFYTVFFQSLKGDPEDFGYISERIISCEKTVFSIIDQSSTDLNEKWQRVGEVAANLGYIANYIINSYFTYYQNNVMTNPMLYAFDSSGYISCINILYVAGNTIISTFGEDFGRIAADCWKQGVYYHHDLLMRHRIEKKSIKPNIEIMYQYIERIKAYDPSYIPPK